MSPGLLTTDDSHAAEEIAARGSSAPRGRVTGHRPTPSRAGWASTRPITLLAPTSIELSCAGWVLLCSDGLWNYCSEPRELSALVAGAGRRPRARIRSAWLPLWSTGPTLQGGADNITAALARIDPR